MVTISALFDEAKIYLPQVLAASNAMEAALKVFEPLMRSARSYSKGVIVLGTVHGDVHEIGKNVIAAMLRGAGTRSRTSAGRSRRTSWRRPRSTRPWSSGHRR
jgi:methanogenic corrinoid protein MtbC1